jgi:hypothetical protein
MKYKYYVVASLINKKGERGEAWDFFVLDDKIKTQQDIWHIMGMFLVTYKDVADQATITNFILVDTIDDQINGSDTHSNPVPG